MIEVIGYMTIGVVFAMVLPILKAWAESKDTWVDLTDEEIFAASESATYMDELDAWVFARNILDKCKEKNHVF